MSDPLYKKELLRLAADAAGAGRLPDPQWSATALNPTCGDSVTVDLSVVDGRIASLAHYTRACVLAQASASILGADLTGLNRTEVTSLRDSVRAMLEGGSVPTAPFDSYAAFDGVSVYKSRHRCVLLPFEAILAAFDTSELSEPNR